MLTFPYDTQENSTTVTTVSTCLSGRYVLGHDAMRRMGEADILIAGMRGLGVEVAKNVILAGVRSVMVQDEGMVEWNDLSSQVDKHSMRSLAYSLSLNIQYPM